MKNREVVEKWVECFNRADIDGLCELYHQDAINHQVVTEPSNGLEEIRKLFEIEFGRAKMVCQVQKIHDAGDWIILEWSDPAGLRGCGIFHIIDSRIAYQRGYFDQLSFFRSQGLGIPDEYYLQGKR